MELQVIEIGDLSLLHEILLRNEVCNIFDKHYTTHGNRKNGVTVGQTLHIWLLYILTENDHRVSHVEDWVAEHQDLLCELIGNPNLESQQFSDDYLGSLLGQLSEDETWDNYEQAQTQTILRVYEFNTEVVRVDSCNIPSYRSPEGIFQYGYSKHRRSDLPQMKLMLSSMNTGGVAISGHCFSGEKTDDLQYIPAIQSAQKQLSCSGILYVGDTKLGSVENRNHIAQSNDYYLTPLSKKYYPQEVLEQAANKIAIGDAKVELIYKEEQTSSPSDHTPVLLAKVYELDHRVVSYTQQDDSINSYTERWIVGKSMLRAEQLTQQLEQRLTKAQNEIEQRFMIKRGRTTLDQIKDVQVFITTILKKYKVVGLLQCDLKISLTKQGKKYPVLCMVERIDIAIAQAIELLGIRLYVTNAPIEKLPAKQIVPLYRKQYKIEQNFHHLLNKVTHLLPLYLRKEDRIKGLVRLCILALKIYHLIQFELRRKLKLEEQNFMTQLVPGQKGRKVQNPTTQQLLKAFKKIKIVKVVQNNQVTYVVDQLNDNQIRILNLLSLNPNIYSNLFMSKNFERNE